jgi:hypothetical protein
MRLAVGPAPLQVILAGEAVERLELRPGKGQLEVLMLPVEGEQPGAEGLELRRGCRAAREEGARPAARGDAPADRDLGRVLGQPLRELGQLRIVEQPLGQLEDPLDVCLARAGADDLERAFPPISRSKE